MSRSVCTEEDWSKIAPNRALGSQYANNNRTGYQSSPWLPDGGFGAGVAAQSTSTRRMAVSMASTRRLISMSPI